MKFCTSQICKEKTLVLWKQSENLFGLGCKNTVLHLLQWLLLLYSAIYLPWMHSDLTEVTFFIQQCNQSFCSLCRDQIVKSTSLVVLYITCPNIITTQYENYVCEAVLPNSRPLYCDLSEKHSGDILQYTFTVSLQHFITSPTFLTIELSANCTN